MIMKRGKKPGSVKSGGRQKGSLNLRTKRVLEILEEMQCSPLEKLIKISEDETLDPALRIRILIELASYAYSKPRSSVEVTTTSFCVEKHEIRLRQLIDKEAAWKQEQKVIEYGTGELGK